MNFIGGSNYQQQSQSADPVAMAQAEYEMDLMTDVFNSLLETCHGKCISSKYMDADLNKGEAVCIDRCVVKYMDVFQRIGTKLSKLQQNPQPSN